jgi:hypothetical protein
MLFLGRDGFVELISFSGLIGLFLFWASGAWRVNNTVTKPGGFSNKSGIYLYTEQTEMRSLSHKTKKVKFVLFNYASRAQWFLSYHPLLEKWSKLKWVFLTTPLEHIDFYLIIGYWTSNIWSFWHMSLEENPLPPHRLLFLKRIKGSFICTFPQTGQHIPRHLLNQWWTTGWNGKKPNGRDPLGRFDPATVAPQARAQPTELDPTPHTKLTDFIWNTFSIAP